MARKGVENLIPINERDKDEQRKIRENAGRRSGEVRREKAQLKSAVKLLLSLPVKDPNIKKQLSALGMSDKDIAAGIAAYKPVGGRAAIVEAAGYNVINDCYNANPDSMKSAIESLAMCPGRKVAVLGDMYELGSESVNMHREMGEVCVKEGIDMLITCGALGVDIGEAAKEAGMTDVIHFADCESLAAAICGLVKQGDYVLVKASHGLHLEAVVEALTK